jgi:hypothetical protein
VVILQAELSGETMRRETGTFARALDQLGGEQTPLVW